MQKTTFDVKLLQKNFSIKISVYHSSVLPPLPTITMMSAATRESKKF